MNVRTGEIRELEAALEATARRKTPPETAESVLARSLREVFVLDDEVHVPIRVGDEVGPYRGWFFRVEYVDVPSQRIVIKPARPAPATKRALAASAGKSVKKRRKKGKRGYR